MVKLKIDPKLHEFSKKFKTPLISILRKSVKDVSPLIEKLPSVINLKIGTISLPFSKYDKPNDVLEINIFPLFFKPTYGEKGYKDRDDAIRYIFNHEILESLQNAPINFNFKNIFNIIFSALSPSINTKMFKNLIPCEESLEIFCNEVCSDVKTDRQLMGLKHNRRGFFLVHNISHEIEKECIDSLEIKKEEDFFLVNKEPYQLTSLILSEARRSIFAEEAKFYGWRLGRFETQLIYHTINKKLKYSPLQKKMLNIRAELKKPDPLPEYIFQQALAFTKLLKQDLSVPN